MEKKLAKIRKQNMKLYTLYRSISLDLIFFYAIEVLFLTQVKNITIANIVLSQSFYAIFMVIMQIPASIVIDRIGTKECIIISNVFECIFILLIIFCNGYTMLIFAQFIKALCFSLKDISDSTLIHCSIPETSKEGEIFSKLEGKSYKNYYVIDAIAAIIAGFLYVINPYIPLFGSLLFAIVSTVISLGFTDIEFQREKPTIKKYVGDLVDGIKFIVGSQRLRSLFLYSGIAWGVFCLAETYRTSILMEIGTKEQFITIIVAITGLASSIGSRQQLKFHNCFRNKSLSMILYIITGAILVAGIAGVICITYKLTLVIIIIAFILIFFAKGIHNVLSTRYLGNFADEKILTQLYALNAISKNIFRAVIGFVGSYLLNITSTANSMILTGIILLVTVLGLVSYMKTRLGLKPEQYDEKEIYNL